MTPVAIFGLVQNGPEDAIMAALRVMAASLQHRSSAAHFKAASGAGVGVVGEALSGSPILTEGSIVAVGDVRVNRRAEVANRLRLTSSVAGDLALIVAARRQCGRSALANLSGDFAFATWDMEQR